MLQITNNELTPQEPTLGDSCPMSTLLTARVTHMSDAELQAHVTKLRAAREVPSTFRALLKGKEKTVKKSTAKKVNLDLLFQ